MKQLTKPLKRSQLRTLMYGVFEPICLCLLLAVTGIKAGWSGQTAIGKIVIDGAVIGGGNMPVIKGSGVRKSEQRRTGEFHRVLIRGGVDVHYRRASETRLEVTGDQNLLPFIKTDLSSGLLTVGSTGNYQSELPLVVELESPHLVDIKVEGAGEILLKDLNEDRLNLELNGSGQLVADGRVGQLFVIVNGSSAVSARNLSNNSADLLINGSGSIDIVAKQSLRVVITGSGKVNYYGRPERIEQQIMGSGQVQPGD